MGQATPASRCEPTFRSSETPALLVPKQRHAQCRADLGQGPGHTLKNVHTTNHQSPITSRYVCFTVCLFMFHDISPDLDGYHDMFVSISKLLDGMFHGMFVY